MDLAEATMMAVMVEVQESTYSVGQQYIILANHQQIYTVDVNIIACVYNNLLIKIHTLLEGIQTLNYFIRFVCSMTVLRNTFLYITGITGSMRMKMRLA